MEKSIALFGTSADPPTIGHKKILEELSKIYAFTISYVSNNPQKKHIEDISIRSHLLKTLIDDLDNPKILFNQKISSQWAVESIKKCKEIYTKSKVTGKDPCHIIQNIILREPEILNHINFYFSNRNLNNNFVSFLP